MKKPRQSHVPLLSWDLYTYGIKQRIAWSKLPIGGFLKQSLIDYPGNIAAVLFTQGCNFRCIYCHNPDLVLPSLIQESEKEDPLFILNWLEENRQLLDAVVITGGEPTIHHVLPEFISHLKNMKLKVKLDTNGTNPDMLRELIAARLIDFIAMDVKAHLIYPDYKLIAGKGFLRSQLKKIKKSIDIITCSDSIEYEFRTTLLKDFHTDKSIESIVQNLKGRLVLQNFRPTPKLSNKSLLPFAEHEKLKRYTNETVLVDTR